MLSAIIDIPGMFEMTRTALLIFHTNLMTYCGFKVGKYMCLLQKKGHLLENLASFLSSVDKTCMHISVYGVIK
jgi:hypothetical protein